MQSLREILLEDIDYWNKCTENNHNRLLKIIANKNILKRRQQLRKLNRNKK